MLLCLLGGLLCLFSVCDGYGLVLCWFIWWFMTLDFQLCLCWLFAWLCVDRFAGFGVAGFDVVFDYCFWFYVVGLLFRCCRWFGFRWLCMFVFFGLDFASFLCCYLLFIVFRLLFYFLIITSGCLGVDWVGLVCILWFAVVDSALVGLFLLLCDLDLFCLFAGYRVLLSG